MIYHMVESTSESACKPAHTKKWLRFRQSKWIDDQSIWMFIDGSSTGWHAAVILDPFSGKRTELAEFKEPKSANVGPELWSLSLGLKHVDPTKPLTVVCDYIGTAAWLVNAWRIKSPNVQEAVDEIRYLIRGHDDDSIRFIHTAGHQKKDTDFGVWNDRADALCNAQQVTNETVDWEIGF